MDHSGVQQILDNRLNFEKTKRLSSPPENLALGDNIRLLHYLAKILKLTMIGRLFDLTPFVIARIRDQKSHISDESVRGILYSVKRLLKPCCPEIDSEVVQFDEFASSLCLPLMCSFLQERAFIAAEWAIINGFKSSNG